MKAFKGLIIRFVIFIFLMLLIIPLWFSTFLNVHYVWAIRASFFFLKIFKLAIISCLLLFFIIWSKIKTFKGLTFNWKQTVVFGALALLFFYGSFYTQRDMTGIVNEGAIVKDDTLNFDGERWLGFSLISDTHEALYHPYIEGDNYEARKLKKQIFFDNIPNKQIFVKWSGSWQDINGNNKFDDDIRVFMIINNNSFNITSKFSSLSPKKASWLELEIPKEILLQGRNELILKAESEKNFGDDIMITSQNVYVEDNSFVTDNGGKSWYAKQEEFLWYIINENSLFYTLLFKLGFILRILGIISLFIAVFGLKFSKFIIKTSYKELFFSTIFAYWVYWFSEFIKTKWYFFSGIVAKSIYYLFKITGFKSFVNMNVEVPIVGIQGFIAGVYEVCSGVDSMGFFTLAYFMLIILNWRRITLWKTILMYFVGLIGIFFLNIIRVYILIIIGAKISSTFAINAFHTNAGMVFSVIYFLLFLPFALKIIEKKRKK